MEKEKLSARLGYTNYSSLMDHLNDIGAAMIRLIEKYSKVNNATSATAAINTSVDALVKLGKITALKTNVRNNSIPCLRELYAAIGVRYLTSVTVAALNECIRAAGAEFRICLATNGWQ